jgi:hypothetical protein
MPELILVNVHCTVVYCVSSSLDLDKLGYREQILNSENVFPSANDVISADVYGSKPICRQPSSLNLPFPGWTTLLFPYFHRSIYSGDDAVAPVPELRSCLLGPALLGRVPSIVVEKRHYVAYIS